MHRTMLLLLVFLTMSSASRSGLYAGLVMRGTPATTECAGSSCSLMMMPRLRGGSNKIDIDQMCQLDPTRIAGIGIGLKKDKVCVRVSTVSTVPRSATSHSP